MGPTVDPGTVGWTNGGRRGGAPSPGGGAALALLALLATACHAPRLNRSVDPLPARVVARAEPVLGARAEPILGARPEPTAGARRERAARAMALVREALGQDRSEEACPVERTRRVLQARQGLPSRALRRFLSETAPGPRRDLEPVRLDPEQAFTPVGDGVALWMEMVPPAEESPREAPVQDSEVVREPTLWTLGWAFDVAPQTAFVASISASRQVDEAVTDSMFDPDYAWFGLGVRFRF